MVRAFQSMQAAAPPVPDWSELGNRWTSTRTRERLWLIHSSGCGVAVKDKFFTALNRDLDTSISPSYQRRIGPKVNCSAGLRNHLLLVSIDIYGNFLGTERGASHILDAATV
ncbi:Uncharacterized protein HZ326_2667 [Fusarium oxysporum f. sp. albedinis]|nr:Uncharacterized protein HZ326_2667 [Fusarium oxysporum f. sp. albedinis]KAK2485328.1 hypothetical protein H9L39_03308 [Fusarium oxysporum f. sp. albedinis]